MTVTVIGVDARGLPPGGQAALTGARLVVGSREHLAAYAPRDARTLDLHPFGPAADALAAHTDADGPAVVLTSGDPGCFGVVTPLRERGLRVAVLPSLSVVQHAVAAAGRSWDDVAVVSTARAGSLGQALNVCRARPAVVVLTTPGAGPAELGRGLDGWRRVLVVVEDPGGPAQRVSAVDPADAVVRHWYDSNVVVCLADANAAPKDVWLAGGELVDGWALPESEFASRDGVRSAELRAVVLARLEPRPGTLVWDVGAGSGEIGVECARLGAAVVAVESDPVQGVRIVANAAAHGVDVRVEESDPRDAVGRLPRPDAVFVGAGGPAVVRACATSGARRIVVAPHALDEVGPVRDALRDAGYDVSGVQLTAAPLEDLPGGGVGFAPVRPALVLVGRKR
ncbi:bifunctional cobalt-precorrin-7 (C(5))-methyltransferase/cobalt-precorrin-6B (C(15))-methyltransferase [Umezawaea beigongshangensis]|uniref:bifunctional cobalt-precorrin-7 (C(5))-methyltransferase/cobalt-precorrin-6B (C(15))-methyltransferase n=1 Tax=Umezawaea beigongshangensis TaxID=2780383 RepID=UPI0018F19F74|nr:bifunctional cobalt-precorrin-7 (C(5))-methyltransferase CbiE/decarboxylating cobalt-precorrin-6B (C(15))-methyltransferase CbiT [Umezawaea beigongshangensis]